jgi:hypothetical protein
MRTKKKVGGQSSVLCYCAFLLYVFFTSARNTAEWSDDLDNWPRFMPTTSCIRQHASAYVAYVNPTDTTPPPKKKPKNQTERTGLLRFKGTDLLRP